MTTARDRLDAFVAGIARDGRYAEATPYVDAAVTEAVTAEREACAEIAEELYRALPALDAEVAPIDPHDGVRAVAAAIRARRELGP